MNNLFINHQELIWPLVLLLAWIIGEIGQHLTKIPKISFYIFCGFILSKQQFGMLPDLNNSGVLFLVNIVAGLVLFEFGYRINLRWLKNNPIIIVTSIAESLLTFIVIFIISMVFGFATLTSLEFAAIFMATSPFVIMWVINQEQSSGQVTERVLHLTALNCIFAIFIFKLILAMLIFQKSGSLPQAVWSGVVMLILSVGLGVICALFLSNILRLIPSISKDRTVLFALMIVVIVAITKSLQLSSIIAALAFGLLSRHNRTAVGNTQRNFGALGDLLIVILFVALPLNLDHRNLDKWLLFAIMLFLGRLIAKVIVVAVFSRINGASWYKGILTGLALTPVSILPILLLDQVEFNGLTLNHDLVMVSGLVLFLELVGPIVVKYSLDKAKESI